jgi:deoxyribodipyrimidine photo-lyase
MVNPERVFPLNAHKPGSGPVVYWMGRDQRSIANHALTYAADCAKKSGSPLYVLFCVVPNYKDAISEHFRFMLEGLREVALHLKEHGIPFFLRSGDPYQEIPRFLSETKASLMIVDFDPVFPRRSWHADLPAKLKIPVVQVDAHNIVPCIIASPHAEFGAYTLRPKIHRRLIEFLDGFMELPVFSGSDVPKIDWDAVFSQYCPDDGIQQDLPAPGQKAALDAMINFIEGSLSDYPEACNDPNREGQSGLSPWLHFGMLSPQLLAMQTISSGAGETAVDAFIEELVVRRELAENFCWYHQDYSMFTALPEWAQKSLKMHHEDEREYLYTYDEFKAADTHDKLWNAAQRQMMRTGRMHGYLRMYWAKKILEWSPDPETAIDNAIRLNDTFSIDGRDPNGYAGILWSIGGLHDRAWKERPVYGKIRYMNAAGCRRKFDVDAYIEKWKK